jgi:Tol biopolymer transport system component
VRGQIAFVSKPGGQADIFVTNADGTGRRRLTNNAAKDIGPTWSPDGTKIASTATATAPATSRST